MFFITNGEPTPQWDMILYIVNEFGFPSPSIIIPANLAYNLATVFDFIAKVIKPIVDYHPTFSTLRVVNSTRIK